MTAASVGAKSGIGPWIISKLQPVVELRRRDPRRDPSSDLISRLERRQPTTCLCDCSVGAVAQPYVEQLFRDTVATSEFATLVTGVVVTGVTERDDEVEIAFEDDAGTRTVITAPYVIGCDGPGSETRQTTD